MMTFTEYLNERWDERVPVHMRIAAGVAIIHDNKILLVHPTNGSWQTGTCGIPKGKVDSGEDPIQGALREVYEETGIALTIDQLDPSPETVHFYRNGKVNGRLIYYICNISDLSEIGLTSLKLPKSNLQLEEVDWAAFVDVDTAYRLMAQSQMIILDRHLKK